MRKINLVTFDVTGTLLNFNRSIGEIYADAANNFGIRVDPQNINLNLNKEMSIMNKQHPNFGLHSGIGWQRWWKTVVIKTFDSTITKNNSSSIEHQCLEPLANYLIDRFATKNELKLTEDSMDLLKYLESKAIVMGIISNYDPRLHKILVDSGISKYFSFIVTSYESGYEKPNINIFKKAEIAYASIGNKFNINSTVHVGDSYENDYCGAKNAGWNAVLISPSPKEIFNNNDLFIYKNLSEFRKQYMKS